MCRTVAVAAMRAGDLLTAVLPVMPAVFSHSIQTSCAGSNASELE